MASKKKAAQQNGEGTNPDGIHDLTKTLIADLNKEFGLRIAYNLAEAEAPTIVKRWIDTGSIQLNYAIKNAVGGGYPEGRIIEITGLPSTGKSHLAYHAASHVQALGGLVVYIDTENATPVDKLKQMGIDVRSRFIYVDTHCTEEVFQVIESTVTKAKLVADKNVPILVIWDSLAATSPKAELEGDYDQNTVGLQARVMSKGLRKLTGIIGQNNVTLLVLNQLREKIGNVHGDPYVSPGGKALPYHASIRVRLGSGFPVKDKAGNVIGSHVTVSIKKNKVAPPHKSCEFDIIFGRGITEHEFIFDECRRRCEEKDRPVLVTTKDGTYEVKISGTGAWKEITVFEPTTGEVLLEKKFYKSEFGVLMKDPMYKPFIDKVIDEAYVLNTEGDVDDGESPDTDDHEDEAAE